MQQDDTLKSRTARSSIKLIQSSLRSLRQATSDGFDEASIEEILRSADQLSTSLKRLESYLPEKPAPDAPKAPAGAKIDIRKVSEVLAKVTSGRFCPDCGLPTAAG